MTFRLLLRKRCVPSSTTARLTTTVRTFAILSPCPIRLNNNKKRGGGSSPTIDSPYFAPQDLDLESLQHPYWSADEDFFVPYADDEIGDEGGIQNPLMGGDEGLFGDEELNIPSEEREMLGKEWK